jgi:hypothetical protein
MTDDEFDDESEPELEDDDVDLEEDVAEDDDVDIALDDEEADIEVDLAVAPPARARGAAKQATNEATTTTEEEDDDALDLEEELHPDDVEDPLDVLLKERTKAERIDDDEDALEDEEIEVDDRVGGSTKIVPRRDDEFLCRSCFLVKPLSQLAAGEKDLCRDCE